MTINRKPVINKTIIYNSEATLLEMLGNYGR